MIGCIDKDYIDKITYEMYVEQEESILSDEYESLCCKTQKKQRSLSVFSYLL